MMVDGTKQSGSNDSETLNYMKRTNAETDLKKVCLIPSDAVKY